MAIEYNGYKIEGDKTFGMFLVKPISAGSVPSVLRGAYTKVQEAMNAINCHLQNVAEEAAKPAPVKKVKLTPREVNDGATEDNSGD